MNPIPARRASGVSRPLCKFGFASVAALALTSIAPPAAYAQADDEEVLEEIVTTGTRLKANPNLASAVPVLSVTGEEAAVRGNVRVEDFVNVLPQVFANQASEVSNAASGTASLNLRGLGRNRTMVMIDGRRLPYGSSQISAPNLDIIPTQLIERVDILTGGASAVYGSDAIGGVANFILKRDFEGVEFGGQYGVSYNDNDDDFWANVLRAGSQPVPGSVTDGEETLIYGILGVNSGDGRGNATIFASYEDRKQISQADRVFSGCALGQDDGPESFGGFGCVGSGNYRLFVGSEGNAFQLDDGTIVPYAGGPSQTFNFGPFNFFQRPSERFSIYGKGHYAVTDDIEAFADISFMNNLSDAQIAPSASFGTSSYQLNCDHPFLQTPGLNLATDIYGCTDADIANGVIKSNVGASHRNVEGGPRNSRLENSTFRIVSGLRGSFADDIWSWEAYAQFSETRDQAESTNDFVVANLQQAFLVRNDANGNPACIDPSGGCVPYNIFQRGPNGESLVTSAATDFIQGVGLVNGSTSQQIFGATLQADFGEYGVKLPTADYGISALFGVETRTDELDARPDEISQVEGGGFTGVGGATLPVRGTVDVTEWFTEVEVPLVAGITGIQELTLRGQYRYSDYDGRGNDTNSPFTTDTYGLSLAWAPIDELRFRAQFQRAVRAPNVIELYTGQNTNLPNLSPAGTNSNGVQLFDPCASDAPLLSLDVCSRSGVTAGDYGRILDVISGQTQSLTGGNPDLNPEEADTSTFGFVWTPSFVEGLSVSVDYYNILVENAIAPGISAQVTLDNCHATGDPTFCGLITRGVNGSLASGAAGVGFQQTNINIAELETSGVDLQVVYDFEIGAHSFRVDYASTYLDQLDQVPFPGGDPIKCAGFFGNNCAGQAPDEKGPSPEYRHRVVGTWMTPWSVDVGMTWRFFDETKSDTADPVEPKMDAVNYIDLTAAWYIMDESITLRASLLNVLGEDPPIFSGAGPALGNGNTYPTVYDTGTVMTFGFKWNF
jgi:outer membrane receptor protein involved in Fe transport